MARRLYDRETGRVLHEDDAVDALGDAAADLLLLGHTWHQVVASLASLKVRAEAHAAAERGRVRVEEVPPC